MDRFAQMSIYFCIHKFAFVCKLAHLYALSTNMSKLYSIRRVFTVALGRDRKKILFCIYAIFLMCKPGHVYLISDLHMLVVFFLFYFFIFFIFHFILFICISQ